MEEAMKSQRIPETDSIDELARFWDTHDLTDFEDQLEKVRKPVFARRDGATLAIALHPHEAQVLRRMARSEGVEEVILVRAWIREKLRGSHRTDRRTRRCSRRREERWTRASHQARSDPFRPLSDP